MSKWKLILMFSLIVFSSTGQANPKSSDSVELVVGVKKTFFVGQFPPEVHMKVDPFKNQHSFKTIKIPVKWDVDKNIRITGKLTCRKGDEELCRRLFVVGNYPHKIYDTFGLIILDKSQEPVTVTLDDFNKKVDNPNWTWNFGAWGSYQDDIEARTYKAVLNVTVESDV
ncbi:hypothetical protein [Photobacterium kagoshimensis]|uniref:hypothetical protein n=1 Tax=Photobacterium kagoshimensis TaxID=2910242 RepID=UPI003D0CAEE4